LREDEDEAVVTVPEFVGIAIVTVKPQVVIVPFNVEQFEVSVRIGV
jgi:hypothetical protein